MSPLTPERQQMQHPGDSRDVPTEHPEHLRGPRGASSDMDATREQNVESCDAHESAPRKPRTLTKAVSLYLERLGRPPVALVLPNDTYVSAAPSPPRVTVRVRNWSALLRLLWQPSLGFGEGYRYGQIEVEGSLVELCELIESAAQASQRSRFKGLRGAMRRPANDSNHTRENVHHHYDLGNDFYRLWLDKQLLYTCAYFPDPDADLETAQRAKMDLVCRKVRLQPGQRVIEAGCGWGALALHMAEHYGVEVTAYNLSHEQIVYARQRARDRGLESRVTFVEDDWRAMSGECDAFLSVGMLEHVGTRHYEELGHGIARVLRPQGIGLIHSIGRDIAAPLDDWIARYIFPGAEVPSVRQMMDIFEPERFVVLDMENLRLHYARTLEHWLERFEAHADTVRDMFDESFMRAWRLYLSGSIASFRTGGLQLFQVVFSRYHNNNIPWSRRLPGGSEGVGRT